MTPSLSTEALPSKVHVRPEQSNVKAATGEMFVICTGCEAAALAPPKSVTVSVAENVPFAAYVCCARAPYALVPSPKSHVYDAIPSLAYDPPPSKLQLSPEHWKLKLA